MAQLADIGRLRGRRPESFKKFILTTKFAVTQRRVKSLEYFKWACLSPLLGTFTCHRGRHHLEAYDRPVS